LRQALVAGGFGLQQREFLFALAELLSHCC
jgi:hypothetical protein